MSSKHRQSLFNRRNRMQKGGQTWPANSGHREGRKLPIAFAAVLLDNTAITVGSPT
jgi:hypothetical protein